MLAYRLTESAATTAATSIGVRVIEWRNATGRAIRFRLGLGLCLCLTATPHRHRTSCVRRYQRTSAGWGRHDHRIAAVCWHGYRDFFRAVWPLAPKARIQTAQLRTNPRGQRFYTASTFEAMYKSTGDRNIGPLVDPIAYRDCCTCGPEIRFASFAVDDPVTGAGLRETAVRMIRQADIRRCPHVIMVADHYRPDGSCQCDDPDHRAMMIREWEYTESSFAGIPLRKVTP